MIGQVSSPRLKGFRFLRPIISHAVRASHRLARSPADGADLLAERGGSVSCESLRVWCQRFGTRIAGQIRRDRPAPADKWRREAVAISIRSQKHGRWRAVAASDDVLETLVQSRRKARVDRRFLE